VEQLSLLLFATTLGGCNWPLPVLIGVVSRERTQFVIVNFFSRRFFTPAVDDGDEISCMTHISFSRPEKAQNLQAAFSSIN
jgi:hypothetical protein